MTIAYDASSLWGVISGRIAQIQAMGDAAFDSADAAITALQSFNVGSPDYDISGIGDTPPAPHFDDLLDLAPTAPVVEYHAPDDVIDLTLDDVTLGTVIDPPVFNVADIDINIPTIPFFILPPSPGTIPDPIDVPIPDKPPITLPDLPVFYQVTIPEMMALDIPRFDANYPSENLVVPNNTILTSQEIYESSLLSAAQIKLYNDVINGGTGLAPEVEQAIYDRDLERALLALQDEKDRITNEWSKRGFPLPDGVLVNLVLASEIEYLNKRLDTSREILINQAKLAQDNTHFAIEKCIALEGTLIDYQHKINVLAFEMSTKATEVGIAIYNASVERYKAQLEGYKARAAVYESRIKGELVKAEIYKAQVEGVKAISETNKAYADLYKSQIAGVEALISMYKTDLEASKLYLENSKLKVDIFKVRVEAYTSLVNARTAEYNMYQARANIEKVRADVYKTQVDAYSSRVDAWGKQANTVFETAKVKVEMNRALIQGYTADIEKYRAQVQGEASRIEGIVKAFVGEVDAYRAESSAYGVLSQIEIEIFKGNIQKALAQAELDIKAADVEMRSIIGAANVMVEAKKGAAASYAQLAAGAMAGVSTQASVSSQAQYSESHTYEES